MKLLVVQIVYYIIPTIIVLLVGWVSGTYSAFAEILAFIGNTVSDTVDPSMAISAVPQDLWAPLFTGLAITGIVAIILYIIFGLLLEIAMCRLAKYGDIGEAINFKEVIADIQAIGIGRFIAWFIILFICALVLGFVLGIITAIPFIGILIAFLVGAPFIALFGARSLGNLYADEE